MSRESSIKYEIRYRADLRVATTVAESAVNFLVAKSIGKKRQMRWSQYGGYIFLIQSTMRKAN
ncbi:hypothetical protein [Rhizobium jaguaris]|uniref:Transposase n=1 Tax=Rhizobium jaguaris TaxID=1312183 RepID=A0A387G492_9HYPH|nr:hypothetical protein [Rhizobium jaguaris]AYG64175.1 hypothetical protein CCGE525_36090 [Rhizobium jaguaris]